jgi:threonine dehydratase
MPDLLPVKVDDIRLAHDRVAKYVRRTPVVTCDQLDRLLNAQVFLKCENLQVTGSFKARGACNLILSLSDDQAGQGVVTHSSGNHAAAVAWAVGLRGISASIVMPADSRPNKIRAVRSQGIEPVLCKPTPESRQATAQKIIDETGGVLVHPYNDARTIAGQGTAALELLEQVPDLDVVIAPVGGGGLLSGTLIAIKSLRPATRVFAAEPALADDTYRSWRSGELQPPLRFDTIADGLRTPLGSLNYPVLMQLVDGVLLASERGIANANRMLLDDAKLVVEPSGAVPLAAAMENDVNLRGRRVGLILSGGNLDLKNLAWSDT